MRKRRSLKGAAAGILRRSGDDRNSPARKFVPGTLFRRNSCLARFFLALREQLAEYRGGVFADDAFLAGEAEAAGAPQGRIERRVAVAVLGVGAGARAREKAQDVVVALQRGAMRRRASASIRRVHVEPGVDQESNRLDRLGLGLVAAGRVLLGSAEPRRRHQRID